MNPKPRIPQIASYPEATKYDRDLASDLYQELDRRAPLAAPIFQGVVTAGSFVVNTTSTAFAWTVDGLTTPVTLINGATFDFPAGSGLILVNDQTVDGKMAAYIAGGGQVSLLGQTGTYFVQGAPAAGQCGLVMNSSNYRLINNTGVTRSMGIAAIRTRLAA